MSGKTKSRSWSSEPLAGQKRSSIFVGWSPYSLAGVSSSESEVTFSHARLNGRWSGGGPWHLNRSIQTFNGPPQRVNSGLFQGTTRMGSALASVYPMQQYTAPSDAQLLADGTTAIARTEPTSPAFDLSVFLGELRAEGLPNLPGTAVRETTRRAKAAGGEYLNLEFGWLPLVRGVRDFAKTVDNSDQILRSYQEQANKVIQRGYEFPLSEESHAEPMSFGSAVAGGGNYTQGGCYQHRRQRKWLEVEYIYHLPTGQTRNDKFRRYGSYARKLLGIDLSPEVLWNLSPWSWAADWFGNVGDVMHNISALGTDGLVIRNGYIMCHMEYTRQDSGRLSGSGPMCTHTTIKETKSRLSATPFGFGVSYSGLSLKQTAIVAALGLSKW